MTLSLSLLLMVITMMLPSLTMVLARGSCSIGNVNKLDCGYAGIDQQGCQAKGCCWQPVSVSTSVSTHIKSNDTHYNDNGIAWCYYAAVTGYVLTDFQWRDDKSG
jgi:hypothetical protein